MASSSSITQEPNIKNVNQELYKRNLDLAVTNRTLSLLRKLYQITLLSLDPAAIANKVSQTILEDLNLEIACMFVVNEDSKALYPLALSTSDRLKNINIDFNDIPLIQSSIFTSVLDEKKHFNSDRLRDVLNHVVPNKKINLIETIGNIKTTLVYPLNTETRAIGVLILSMNRKFSSLSTFEKESIDSFINVIAVALDKAYLYEELEETNVKLEKADRMKSQFLSFASHQVKSPMAAIKGFAQLIQDGSYGKVPDQVKETAEKIQKSSDRLIVLVNNLLDLRKLEEGRIEYKFADMDIAAMVHSVIDEAKTIADEKKVELKSQIPSGAITIRADEEKIRQIVQNLVDNAIKYTEKGWVKVDLDDLESDVQITVSDSGIGIPSEILPTLFEQFNRGSKQAKKIQGTGLGLYIAKQFAIAHNGSIEAKSEGPGKGSMFIVKIPKQHQT